MTLYPMNNAPTPVIGDDLAYNSIAYSKVPAGCRLSDLTVPAGNPKTTAVWATMTAAADEYYQDHEIVGRTFKDFFAGLKRAWALNADTFERLLEVYDDDIAKPILGRTEVVTYGEAGAPVTVTDTHTDTEIRQTDSNHVDVPVNGGVGTPTYTDGAVSKVTSGTVVDKHEHTGKVTTELSDLGVRPNYESLNGFLDNNRTALKVFCDIFRDCFTLHESMRW